MKRNTAGFAEDVITITLNLIIFCFDYKKIKQNVQFLASFQFLVQICGNSAKAGNCVLTSDEAFKIWRLLQTGEYYF